MAKGVRDLVVYIERKQLSFYGGAFEKVITFPLDKKLVNDLEMIDRNALIEAISDLVKVSSASARLIIIFSDSVSILEDLGANLTSEQLTQAEKSFYSTVPFDETATKLVKTAKGFRAVGVNWEFYRVIIEALAPKGFKIAVALPAMAVPEFDQKAGLTDKVASTIVSKLGSFNNYGFYQGPIEKEETDTAPQRGPAPAKKSKLLPILIGVFVFFVVVLVILLLARR